MPLSWNEIRNRAIAFSAEWADDTSEHAEAKTFWDQFFNVFGVPRRRIATFEKHVDKAGGKAGFIDLFWPGVLIAEHKSRGKNLSRAFDQAIDYFPGIRDVDLPRYVVVSDFARFRIHDLDTGEETEFPLVDLHTHVQAFGFMAGYESRQFKEQDPVNIKAASRLASLHDGLLEVGYDGHDLEVYLVRLLFCMFAEDTGIFLPRGAFQDFIQQRTSEDGSDLASRLSELFEVLNTPENKRLKSRDEQILQFPYVNGRLFEERLRIAAFDSSLRQLLLDCCDLDWGQVSPAIFGSLFQGIMDAEARRNMGAHYTSEKNIMKVIGPLFLDDLKDELSRTGKSKAKLQAFHEKLGSLNFLDPACGCGNFLVITYREIRLLELEVIRRLYGKGIKTLQLLDVIDKYIKVDVDQFHGIEIEEWPAQIAQVAMWLIDHQMNVLVSQEFGNAFVRIPLTKSANIVNTNALKVDWNDVIPTDRCSYVFGNPPFLGKQHQSSAQKADLALVYGDAKGAKELDFVAAWYVKAARYAGPNTRCAFVSTNSISQGEQVGLLWSHLMPEGVQIHFAHRTFRWSNEAPGMAAVHCVIIGFSKNPPTRKVLYDYEDVAGEPHALAVSNINSYLVDAANILLRSRRTPICPVPPIVFGSMPNDGGNLLMSDEEKEALLKRDPGAERWVKKFMGAREFINAKTRWCLWLKDMPPNELARLPSIQERVEAVKKYRLSSKREATRKLASYPSLFGEIRQPSTPYLMLPSVSSERRPFIPIGFQDPDLIASNLCLVVPDATLFHFGVLTSTMHMSWVRTVCGRLKSDYRYTNEVVYNNFPWPMDVTENRKQAVEAAAQGVLDARDLFPTASLADLYDPITMPPALVKAHQALDRAVDAAYGRRKFKTEAERVGYLFELYQECVGGKLLS